jgi:hypothetical protein
MKLIKVKHYDKILMLCIISALINLSCCLSIPLSPKDDYRDNITLEEAQSLVPFSICFPSYLPPGIDPSPEIIYHSEWEAPEETDIRLRYKEIYKNSLIFEISQRFNPNEVSLKTEYSESSIERVKYIFVYWLLPGNTIDIESMVTKLEFKHEVFETNQTIWWFYEFVKHGDFIGTMTEWIKNKTQFSVIGYLPSEEAKKVTISMFDCPIDRIR